ARQKPGKYLFNISILNYYTNVRSISNALSQINELLKQKPQRLPVQHVYLSDLNCDCDDDYSLLFEFLAYLPDTAEIIIIDTHINPEILQTPFHLKVNGIRFSGCSFETTIVFLRSCLFTNKDLVIYCDGNYDKWLRLLEKHPDISQGLKDRISWFLSDYITSIYFRKSLLNNSDTKYRSIWTQSIYPTNPLPLNVLIEIMSVFDAAPSLVAFKAMCHLDEILSAIHCSFSRFKIGNASDAYEQLTNDTKRLQNISQENKPPILVSWCDITLSQRSPNKSDPLFVECIRPININNNNHALLQIAFSKYPINTFLAWAVHRLHKLRGVSVTCSQLLTADPSAHPSDDNNSDVAITNPTPTQISSNSKNSCNQKNAKLPDVYTVVLVRDGNPVECWGAMLQRLHNSDVTFHFVNYAYTKAYGIPKGSRFIPSYPFCLSRSFFNSLQAATFQATPPLETVYMRLISRLVHMVADQQMWRRCTQCATSYNIISCSNTNTHFSNDIAILVINKDIALCTYCLISFNYYRYNIYLQPVVWYSLVPGKDSVCNPNNMSNPAGHIPKSPEQEVPLVTNPRPILVSFYSLQHIILQAYKHVFTRHLKNVVVVDLELNRHVLRTKRMGTSEDIPLSTKKVLCSMTELACSPLSSNSSTSTPPPLQDPHI
ncbi:hypothetical protein NEHOM01_2448, partial [Nematocida homosporus]|uniref:uncharacterized protein n=1 Tax=Nematocida homosporus TaxID=1912981 RepID=UPI00221ED30B